MSDSSRPAAFPVAAPALHVGGRGLQSRAHGPIAEAPLDGFEKVLVGPLVSALLAVLLREPDSERYENAIATAASCRMSAVNVLMHGFSAPGRPG